jgi:hypothetical protein
VQPRQDVGAKVLEQYVALRDELEEKRDPLGALEVERQRPDTQVRLEEPR